MKQRIPFLLILLLIGKTINIHAQTITNVTFRQVENHLEIVYDLTGDIDKAFVSLYVSTDGGRTYKGPLKKTTGDVGENVMPGTRKKIQWDVLNEIPDFSGEIVFNVRAKVDETKTPIPTQPPATTSNKTEEPEPAVTKKEEKVNRFSFVDVGSSTVYKVVFTSGIEMKGTILRMDDEKLLLMSKGRSTSIKIDDISRIELSSKFPW